MSAKWTVNGRGPKAVWTIGQGPWPTKGKNDARASYMKLAADAPFSYYGILARSRLRAQGEQIHINLKARKQETVAVPGVGHWSGVGGNNRRRQARLANGRAEAAARRIDLLVLGGFDSFAVSEIHEAESDFLSVVDREPAACFLLDRYRRTQGFHRAMRLNNRYSGVALAHKPVGLDRTHWEHAYPQAYRKTVFRHVKTGLPPGLFYAIMRKESEYNPNVVSYANAKGLMQLLPDTAARVATKSSVEEMDVQLLRPTNNIKVAASYLKGLHRKFRKQPALTAAAYNAGPAATERFLKRYGHLPTDAFVEMVSYEQTREYIKRVLTYYSRYLYLYKGAPLQIPLSIQGPALTTGPNF